jgi:hypothetical protein
MAGIDFGKQMGPLPLGAWIAVVGGGLAIAYWQRNAASGDTSGNATADTTGPDANDVGTGPGWTAVPPPSGNPTDGNTVTYETNEAWGQAAINWLIAQGYNPGISSSAITKALNGGVDINGTKMSVQEWTLWSLALTHFGSPPYPVNVAPPTGVPGPVTGNPKPPPSKPPVPKPPSTKTPPYWDEVAHSGDSVSKIAARHGKGWKEVWAFNLKYRSPATVAVLKARGPNLIFSGTHIWVPK